MSDFNLGTVTAYGYAKDKGYTGTEDEYAELMASYADVAEQAAESAEQAAASATTATAKASEAAQSATAAASSKTAAETAQSGAETAAQTATTKAGEATTAATTATNKATEATTAATTATGKATEAAGSATTATTKAGEASTSATNAAASATRAQEILDSIPEDYSQLSDDVSDLKDGFDGFVKDKYEHKEPINWFDYSAITMGELLANGTVNASTTRFYTGFVPVSGWTVARFFRGDSLATIYSRHVTCYDADKNIKTGGSDSSSSAFAVPSEVSYIRVTFDYNASVSPKAMITNNVVPTEYSAYFEPTWIIKEDFLTAESEAVINKVKNNELSTNNLANSYVCSAPVTMLRQTVGLPETFYLKTARTPDETTFIDLTAGLEYSQRKSVGVYFPNNTVYNSVNGFAWHMFDPLFTEIKAYTGNGAGGERHFIAENLSDCSLLAIGDSTVDHDVMTQKLLDYFTTKGKTITLLGTLGADGNYNEGRAGWKATDYLTNRVYSVDGRVNPFYNPSVQTFDFSYYMTNQGYSAPDFVVIQLGINDLGDNSQTYANIWVAIKIMIDSIRAYNSNIKIILNLPTTPTANQDNIAAWLPRYKNRVVSYDQYAQEHALAEYGENAVRCSYCHLILDPETEIRDNVHPTNAGYEKMALELVNQINCWQNGA